MVQDRFVRVGPADLPSEHRHDVVGSGYGAHLAAERTQVAKGIRNRSRPRRFSKRALATACSKTSRVLAPPPGFKDPGAGAESARELLPPVGSVAMSTARSTYMRRPAMASFTSIVPYNAYGMRCASTPTGKRDDGVPTAKAR